MDSEFNPYSAPGVTPKQNVDSFPALPLVFRPRLLDYFFLVPVGLVVGSVFAGTTANLLGKLLRLDFAMPDILIAILALLFGAAFVGFFSAVFSSVKVDTNSVRINQLQPKYIPFKEIRSWHFQPVTRYVVVSFHENRPSITFSNYVMTRDRSEVFAKVLRKYVGPPGQV